MARQRMIKPEFFTSESLAECSSYARLCFIGLWVFADDYGREKFSPRVLKSQIFPLDDMTVDEFIGCMCELEEVGCIRLYTDGENVYYEVPNFSIYQTVKNPSKTNIPQPSPSAGVVLTQSYPSPNPKELIKELINKGRGGNADAPPSPDDWMAAYRKEEPHA